MTIALGMLANDGIVLAADTQETIPGFWKNEAAKLNAMSMSSPRKWRCCLTAGAGHGHYIDACRDLLWARFSADFEKGHDEVVGAFETILKDFYREHVIPFAAYPAHECPDFQLLVAACCPEIHLLKSDGSVFIEEQEYAAVGVGSMLATTLLGRFFKGSVFTTVRQAIALTAYIMAQVKDSVDGCGKNTDISGIRNGHLFELRRDETEALEKAVRVYSAIAEPLALSRVVPDKMDGDNPPELKRALTEARKVVAKLHL